MTPTNSAAILDELDAGAPVALGSTIPIGGARVYGDNYLQRTARRMFQPYHIGDQVFKVTPGYVEFHAGTFAGRSLRDMAPQLWVSGTRLYLEATAYWEAALGKSGGGALAYKTGRYTVLAAEVVAYRPEEPDPLTLEGPADTAATLEELDAPSIRRFLLGTIGTKAVSLSNRGYVHPATFSSAFDLAIIVNL